MVTTHLQCKKECGDHINIKVTDENNVRYSLPIYKLPFSEIKLGVTGIL